MGQGYKAHVVPGVRQGPNRRDAQKKRVAPVSGTTLLV
jgi:hypothetical protein